MVRTHFVARAIFETFNLGFLILLPIGLSDARAFRHHVTIDMTDPSWRLNPSGPAKIIDAKL